jgi:cytochrome c2
VDNNKHNGIGPEGKSTSNRTRHINNRYYFVEDRLDSGEINIQCTGDMIADFLTKPLQGKKFTEL